MASLVQARLLACKLEPYVLKAINSMAPIERTVGTLSVDKYWRLYYNQDFLDKLTIQEAAGIVLHEVSHLLDADCERAQRMGLSVDHPQFKKLRKAWNLAADAVINHRLRKEGVILPESKELRGVYPEDFAEYGITPDMTKEEMFRELLKSQDQEKGPGPGGDDDPKPGEGEPQGEGLGPPQKQDQSDQDDQDGDGQGSGPQGDQEDDGAGGGSDSGPEEEEEPSGGGSGSDGIDRDWELPPPAEKNYGEPQGKKPDDVPGITPDEARQLVRDIAEDVKNKSCGKVSGYASRTIEAALDPPVEPRRQFTKLFKRKMQEAAEGNESTYLRLGRRRIPGVLTPGIRGMNPEIGLILDTSGSMSHDELRLGMGLTNKVFKQLDVTEIRVYTGDTMSRTQEIMSRKLSKLEVVGGGGTHMGRLIEQVAKPKEKRKNPPDFIVVITDGETPWCNDVGIPTVACITQKYTIDRVPEWIHAVDMSLE